MWRRSAFLVTAIAVQFCLVGAARSDDIDCDAFARNDDGSWTVIHKAYISGPNIRVEEGAVFEPGGTFLGDDLAKRLDRACPHAAAAPQPAAVAPAQGAAPGQGVRTETRSALAKLADANGNIDVQHITCGQLADASPAESELVLTYFSGWYGGLAKRRGINLARVRYAIRTVGDFCKANRDKSLVQTMELMLK
jgi:HdeA/HdeB family